MSSIPEQHKFFHDSPFLLRVSIGFFLFHVVASQITLGSKLCVDQNNTWVSSDGVFAVGFFNRPDQPNQYSLGIRFNSKSIPASKQTVVWVAGADDAVGSQSCFELSKSGDLILVDSVTEDTVWTSKTNQLAVVSALLRNDGNLVLLNEKKDVVWQSFDNPSDTLLPGQLFPVHGILRASSKNSVSSHYSLYLNASGELQLRWESSVIYWTSGSLLGSNLSCFLTSGGALQLVDQNLQPLWSVFGADHNDTINFRFLRLDVDGNLRIYSWDEASRSWKSVWQAVGNQCEVFATCGEHGICVFDGSGSSVCKCPFKNASDPNSKCLIRNCKYGSSMVAYVHTFLYQIYPPDNVSTRTSLQQCKNLCMQDTACAAATFTNDGTAQCLMMTSPYFSGHSEASLSSVSFIKECLDPSAVDPRLPKTFAEQTPVKRSNRLCIPCLIGAVSGTFVLFAMMQLGLACFIYRRRNLIRKKAIVAYLGRNSKGLMMFPFPEIKDITGNFKHQLGPRMYRGVLPNHQQVAVKDLETTIDERKFRAAVAKIGSIHHRNLVKLEGYCFELGHRILVYEYIKNGSVEAYLEDDELSQKLSWRKRIGICLSVARAICYLHTECREFVCHGNLKCENVVLDKNLEAKVSEFGLQTLYSEALYGGEKDVQDFGKMVLKLVTGCQEVEDVCEWVYSEWIEGRPERVVDKRISDVVDLEELERTLRIIFWCLQSDEQMRPPMSEVVKVLEGTLSVDPPPPSVTCSRLQIENEQLESVSVQ